MRSRRMIGILILCAGIAASAGQQKSESSEQAFPPMITYDPLHQKPMSYSDALVHVSLIIGKNGDSLRIKENGKGRVVSLPEEIGQVDEIRKGINDRIIVRGMVDGSGSEIVVISLKTHALIDKFICYQPSISPSGRFVVFIKHYPLHAEGTTDHYMIYDLARSPENNRPPGVPKTELFTVGKAFYPPGVGNSPYGDVFRHPIEEQNQSRSFFFWSDDSKEVAFADGTWKSLDLVVATIGENGTVSAKKNPMPLADLCAQPGTFSMQESVCNVIVRKIEFPSTIPLKFSLLVQVLGGKTKKIELNAFN